MTAESYVGGALTQEPILEVSSFADQLADTAVLFTHVPAKALGDIDLVGGIGASTLDNAVLIIGRTSPWHDLHLHRRQR